MESHIQPEVAWMSLPKDSRELDGMFTKGIRHPAMKMADIALKMKRSPKQVFVLLVGLSGAGKSSTLNYLLNAEIAPTSDTKSETRSTIEYKVTMESNAWQIPDLTMSIIDTPGFCDTDGLKQDAKNMLSIKHFFQTHPFIEKEALPNLIFIVLNINENRMDGPHSQFSKMLKGLSQIHVVDLTNPNVVVVLTHAASLPRKRNTWESIVDKKKATVKAMVKVHLGVTPEIVVQENKPEDFELQPDGDWHLLPNGEKQPKELFISCKRIFDTSKDEIGHEALAICFRPGTRKREKPVKGIEVNSDEVPQKETNEMHTELLKEVVPKSYSEVGNMLEDYKKTKNITTHYDAVSILQNKLRDLGIQNVNQLQCLTMNELGSRMLPIRIDRQMANVLEDVFGLRYEQVSSIDCHIGKGFDVFKDATTPMTPLVLKGHGSKYGLPDNIMLRECSKHKVRCQSFENYNQYVYERLNELRVNPEGEINIGAFTMKVKYGYNTKNKSSSSQQYQSNQSSFSIEQHIYRLEISKPLKTTPDFKRDVEELPMTYDFKNEDNLFQWKAFFNKWGSHVVIAGYIGGSLTGNVKVESSGSTDNITDDVQKALAIKLSFLQNTGILDVGTTDSKSFGNLKTSKLSSTSLTWNGGDREVHKMSLDNIAPEEWTRWNKSLEYTPAPLWTSLELYPLYHLVNEINKEKGIEMQKAINLVMKGKFVYEPPKKDNRENTGSSNASGSCFDEDATILLVNGKIKRIGDLAVGDLIFTMNKKYKVDKDVIITWLHQVRKGQYKFLEITHEYGKLTITPDHILYMGTNGETSRAGQLTQGMYIWFYNNNSNRKGALIKSNVMSIKTVMKTGVYAPLSYRGSLLVDGVAVSCYCNLNPIRIIGKEIISSHSLAHFGFLPLRLAYRFGTDINTNNIDEESGLHCYAKWMINNLLPWYMSLQKYPNVGRKITKDDKWSMKTLSLDLT